MPKVSTMSETELNATYKNHVDIERMNAASSVGFLTAFVLFLHRSTRHILHNPGNPLESVRTWLFPAIVFTDVMRAVFLWREFQLTKHKPGTLTRALVATATAAITGTAVGLLLATTAVLGVATYTIAGAAFTSLFALNSLYNFKEMARSAYKAAIAPTTSLRLTHMGTAVHHLITGVATGLSAAAIAGVMLLGNHLLAIAGIVGGALSFCQATYRGWWAAKMQATHQPAMVGRYAKLSSSDLGDSVDPQANSVIAFTNGNQNKDANILKPTAQHLSNNISDTSAVDPSAPLLTATSIASDQDFVKIDKSKEATISINPIDKSSSTAAVQSKLAGNSTYAAKSALAEKLKLKPAAPSTQQPEYKKNGKTWVAIPKNNSTNPDVTTAVQQASIRL